MLNLLQGVVEKTNVRAWRPWILSEITASEFIKAAYKYRIFFLFACVGPFTYFPKTLFGKDMSNTPNLNQSFHCAAGLMHLVHK